MVANNTAVMEKTMTIKYLSKFSFPKIDTQKTAAANTTANNSPTH